MCRKGLGDFFKSSGLVDDVIEVEKSRAKSYADALKRASEFQIRHVISPHESFRTAFFVGKVRAAGVKVGFRRWWNFSFFDKRVFRPMLYPDAIRQLSLLAALDSGFSERFSQDLSEVDENSSELKTVSLKKKIPMWASMRVGAERARKKVVLVAPGSVWPTKRWHRQGFAQILRDLLSEGYEVKLIGSKDEVEVCQYIKRDVPEAQNLAGRTTVAELVSLMSESTALIANDSGAIHMAAAAGLPTVAIFGPTTLALGYRPWNDNAIVVQKSLSCRPCSAHGTRNCPLKTHACMLEINSGEVFRAFKSLGV